MARRFTRGITRRVTRRGFLATSVAGGIVILRGGSRSALGFAANERVGLAHVGVGGRGKELLEAFAEHADPVVLCDVDEGRAAEACGRFPGVPRVRDFRVMLDRHGKSVDGVVVATPDHTHAVIVAAAVRAGKHVYAEAPLARTVHESRVLRELARRHKVATSVGIQGTASPAFRRALELIRKGTIGPVKEVHAWHDAGGAGRRQPPPADQRPPAPPHLDWDLWLGPAAERAFHPEWLAWRDWRDFGTGRLGEWGSHAANLAFMALDMHLLWDPALLDGEERRLRVGAKVEAPGGPSFPRWERVTWEAPARGTFPQARFHWHDGAAAPGARQLLEELAGRPLDWGDKGERRGADAAGCVIVGADGTIHATAHNESYAMRPAERFAEVRQREPEAADRSAGHERDWLNAIGGGKAAWANFEYAGPFNEFLQLGNVATRVDRAFEYDPLAARVVGNEAAAGFLHVEYRKGWSLA